MDFKFEFVKALEKGLAYDFVAEHYWEMDKDTLKDVCLECIYELHQHDSDIDCVAECLKELWEV